MRQIIIISFFLGIATYSLGQMPNFQNASSASGINNAGKNYGVSVVDYDNDGDDDIYITRQDGEPNLLYQNDGTGVFVDVAAELGLAHEGDGMLSCWADTDNDGDQDFYLANKNGNDVFYRNDNGVFTDITFLAGIQNMEQPRSVNFADADNDGDLDLYVANILAENQFYLNMGGNLFLNATSSNGPTDTQISMGAIFLDYDNDNDQDLYLTHDADVPFILYENDGTAYFSDVSESSGTNIATNGMGVEKADFNLDGYLDLYITNLYENSLLLNNGDGTFDDISNAAGVEDLGMGWGVFCMDYDNDGYKDIYINNESNIPPMENNKLYRNNGDNTFSIVSSSSIIASANPGIGAACADFDNNGQEDIFIANTGTAGNQLFLNQTASSYHWIKIAVIGTESNRDGIGARVSVTANGNTYINETTSSSGYASQNSRTLHFGLGTADEIDEIKVLWPSGIIDTIYNVSTNQKIVITENQTATINENPVGVLDFNINFQNPTNNDVHIDYNNPNRKNIKLDVLSIQGEIIHSCQLVNSSGHIFMNISNPGTYFIQCSDGGNQFSRRIVIH